MVTRAEGRRDTAAREAAPAGPPGGCAHGRPAEGARAGQRPGQAAVVEGGRLGGSRRGVRGHRPQPARSPSTGAAPHFQTAMRMPQATDQLPGGVRLLDRFSWDCAAGDHDHPGLISSTVQVAMAVEPAECGRAGGCGRLPDHPGHRFRDCAAAAPGWEPDSWRVSPRARRANLLGHIRAISSGAGQQHALTIGLQRTAPESYRGAQAGLVESDGADWPDVIMEGAGLVAGEGKQPFLLRAWAGEPLESERSRPTGREVWTCASAGTREGSGTRSS